MVANRNDNKIAIGANIRKYLKLTIAIIFIIALTRVFILDVFLVASNSMSDSLKRGDFVIASKANRFFGVSKYLTFANIAISKPIRFKFGDFSTGDIVVFSDSLSRGAKVYVKRIGGVPGDTIFFQGDGAIKLRGEVFDVSEEFFELLKARDLGGGLAQIKAGEYFVIGDNRASSVDSRWRGFLAEDDIIATPFFIFMSVDKNAFLNINFSRAGFVR